MAFDQKNSVAGSARSVKSDGNNYVVIAGDCLQSFVEAVDRIDSHFESYSYDAKDSERNSFSDCEDDGDD